MTEQGAFELAGSAAGATPALIERSVGVEDDYAIVAAVGDIESPVWSDGKFRRSIERQFQLGIGSNLVRNITAFVDLDIIQRFFLDIGILRKEAGLRMTNLKARHRC